MEQLNNNNRERNILIRVIYIVSALILLTVGFAMGYVYHTYQSEPCIQDPLTYGVNLLNDMNDDEYVCTCSAYGNHEPLVIDKNGPVKNTNLLQGIDLGQSFDP